MHLPTQQLIGLAAILYSILQYEMDPEYNAYKRNIRQILAHQTLKLMHSGNR